LRSTFSNRFAPSVRAKWMRRLARPAADYALLSAALITVASVRIALWLLPARWIAQATLRLQRRQRTATGHAAMPADRIAWAVRTASRRVPRASCLTQALATQILLVRAGWPSRLTHGIARDERGALSAHAWVEMDGHVLIGDVGLERYARLPDLTTVP